MANTGATLHPPCWKVGLVPERIPDDPFLAARFVTLAKSWEKVEEGGSGRERTSRVGSPPHIEVLILVEIL